MGVAYNGYCYPDANSASLAFNSNPIFSADNYPSATGTAFYQSILKYASVVSDDTVQIKQYKVNSSTLVWQTDNLFPVIYLPPCSTPGSLTPSDSSITVNVPPNSITLQTPASLDSPSSIDTVTASWMVVSVFAAAWALKAIRKTL